ncbi:UNVERIFIED_ORG: hypothetical protein ABIB52_000549 [Arthrobacter sp. UYCu721]
MQNILPAPVHVPVAPPHAADAAVLRNGERQLKNLIPRDMRVLGVLASVDVYPVNENVRGGHNLDVDAGRYTWPALDYYTQLEFFNEVSDMFHRLGVAIRLDKQMTLFRGVGLPLVTDAYSLDIAGLGDHLSTGTTPWQSTFTDAGFGFAATHPQAALGFDGTGNGGWSGNVRPTLFELNVHSGLCVPEQRYRSTGLLNHTSYSSMLDTDISQVIFPPGTQWKITSVTQNSKYGVPLVSMDQI